MRVSVACILLSWLCKVGFVRIHELVFYCFIRNFRQYVGLCDAGLFACIVSAFVNFSFSNALDFIVCSSPYGDLKINSEVVIKTCSCFHLVLELRRIKDYAYFFKRLSYYQQRQDIAFCIKNFIYILYIY